jgi:hypothetical protein
MAYPHNMMLIKENSGKFINNCLYFYISAISTAVFPSPISSVFIYLSISQTNEKFICHTSLQAGQQKLANTIRVGCGP